MKNQKKKKIQQIPPKKESSLKNLTNIYIDKTSEDNGKTIYHIKGDFIEKDHEIIRRYRDFDYLRVRLAENWPGIFIPPIAQKRYLNNRDQRTINERIYQLENFLKVSTKEEYLINTEELQIFLNKHIVNSDAFQMQMKKLKPYTLEQISENYTQYFGNYKNMKTKGINDGYINTWIDFINTFNANLNIYKEKLVEFGEVKKSKIYRESKTISYFSEFEKYSLLDYVNNDFSLLFFFNDNSSLLRIIMCISLQQ